ncbi:hypothetical protein OAG24_01025 [bacterium]|nr:hypothetical protein [bacterium]
MAQTNVFILILVICLVLIAAYHLSSKTYVSDDHPILDQVRKNFSMIDPDYVNIPLKEGTSAYTENKAAIFLCLKDPNNQQYYDFNTIMYVALHELAHIVSKTQGHNDEFKENFSNILKKGSQIGIYDPSKTISSTYCGTESD